jgi:uncharacterized protein (DUF2062 family)/cyclopropane fatty-acyl-phospholipid synthase-like methyltransferase
VSIGAAPDAAWPRCCVRMPRQMFQRSRTKGLYPSAVAGYLRRIAYTVRTEGGGAGREVAAIGLGVFIGCSPFYGFHLLICWIVGWLFRLNRLKLYLAANVSNPVFAPFVVFAELQSGAWVRRGEFHSLTVAGVKTLDAWRLGADLLVGSLIIGGLLAIVTAALTYFCVRGAYSDSFYAALVRTASDRYATISIAAWEFARSKLQRDPVYRMLLAEGLLPHGGTIVDVGCGTGLCLALLAESIAAHEAGLWRSDLPPPPGRAQLVGIEMRARSASVAHRALGDAASIIHADARHVALPRCSAVLLCDILHMMPFVNQETLLAGLAGTLEPGGAMLIREADASRGWRFATVWFVNRAKAVLLGHWRQKFHYRTASEWSVAFERLGFRVDVREAGGGTPFANVLFALTDRRGGSA